MTDDEHSPAGADAGVDAPGDGTEVSVEASADGSEGTVGATADGSEENAGATAGGAKAEADAGGPEGDGPTGPRAGTVEGVATPVETTTAASGSGPGLLARWRRTAGGLDPGRALDALGAADESAGAGERALRACVSFAAVLVYALFFGPAVGAVGLAVSDLPTVGRVPLDGLALATGGLALPAAAFLFVALWDDATLVRPRWTGGHPPLGDAWLGALAAFAAVAVAQPAVAPALGTGSMSGLGWATAVLAAYGAAPFWLARRCLARPSWALGALSLLVGPLVLLSGVIAAGVWLSEASPLVAAIAVVVGTGVPYGLAAASPGPARVAAGLGAVVDAVPGSLGGGLVELLGRLRR